MKLSLLLLAPLLLIAPAAHAADTFNADPAHTQAIFAINHLGYSTVTGSFHDIKATLVLDEQHPTLSHVDATIGMGSVDTGVPARDDVLRSDQFFNVAQFPTMTFHSQRVVKTGAKTADVHGDLSIHGVTRSVVLKTMFNRVGPDQMRNNATVAGFTATTSIKRSDFGMKAFLPYIGDNVMVTLNFEGIKS